jgi:uncharacterized protein YgiM (DUF1202 family)
MKTTFGLLSVVMLATTLAGQTVTNPPVPVPNETASPAAPVLLEASTTTPTNAPAKKSVARKRSAKKAVPKKTFPELKSVPLVAGPAVVIVSNLNVRGQATLKSEVVTHLTKDQVVTVLEEITHKHSAPDEPSAWAKITLPSDMHVWIFKSFVDTKNTVTARKLNLRSGPGENYSVLGLLKRGDEVKPLTTKDEWLAIEAPANTYAFVAAQYLRQKPAEAPSPAPQVAATPQPQTAPPPPVTEAPKPVPPPIETPQPKPVEAPTAVPTAPTAPVVATAPTSEIANPAASAPEPPPSPRVVQREGIVRSTVSIQAPSHFELISTENKKTIDYLHTPSDDLDLSRWKGLRVMVTGQEGLDERWPNTPVLTIEKIEVLSEP